MKDALKLALEALESAKELAGKHDSELEYGFQHTITVIKEALAQDEQSSSQEPVAWDVHTEHCFQGEYKHCCKYGDGDDCTAALKRPWVSLTDDETKEQIKHSDLLDMFEHIGWYSAPRKGFDKNAIRLIQAIEAKLKELNT